MSRSATSTRPTHPTSTNQTSPHYAEALVTPDTVKRHVSHLFAKLQVTNRTQAVAVARARQLGLLP